MPALALVFLLAAGPPSSAPSPRPSPSAAPRPRLDLGPYGAPTAGPPQGGTLTDSPRFESTIDVEDKAPADFNATMAVWWRHFDFEAPAIYGQGKGIPSGGVNLLPLVEKVVDKVKDAKRNRDAEKARQAADAAAEAAARPSPSPSPKP